MKHGASFEVVEFAIGRTNDEYSKLKMRVTAGSAVVMQNLLEELVTLRVPDGRRGATRVVQPAPTDGCAPDDFYSTSNHRTWVRHGGQWLEVERQRMDAAIVIDERPRGVPEASRSPRRRRRRLFGSRGSGSCPSSASGTATALRS